MVYASAGIEYYLFYIQIRRWWREIKMPSFRQSFAYAKYATFEIVSLHTASPMGFCQLVWFAGGLEGGGNLLLGILYPFGPLR